LREAFPDLAEWSRKRKRARKGEAHKTAVSIRLSPEVLAFYKEKGPGWQTRIDETLRAIVAAAKQPLGKSWNLKPTADRRHRRSKPEVRSAFSANGS
jgi:BrnA antitoxin of type II toxin-antitoxin system